ncbi:MAG: hypothetical protein QOH87_3715 [Trebonia sp.]|jgi:chitodextrinase|nr:hypothetical protein [Trebonia sp.]
MVAMAGIGLFASGSAQAATGPELLQNPSFESASGGVPSCWKLGGYGTNTYSWTRSTDAHSGTYAESLSVMSFTSGDRKLLPAQDSGTCAPSVTPGQAYTAGAWYKGPAGTTAAPRMFAYYRTASGGWVYWSASPRFTASSAWSHATWTTPPVPSGATHLAVGLGLTSAGALTMDDFSLTTASSPDSTAPTVPGGLQANPGDGRASLSWSAATDPDSPVAGYYVLRNGVQVANVSSTAYTDTGLSDGTKYSYSVEAYDPSGNVSAPSTPASVTPVDTTAPSVPTGLRATAGNSQVALSWTASTDNVGVTGYRVYRNGALVASPSGTSYTDTGLTDGTAYSYTVAAVDAATNTSAQAGAVSVTPGAGVTGSCPVAQPQTTWAPVGRAPLTDAQAAACVQHVAEAAPANAPYAGYVPTAAEESAWQAAIPNQEHGPEVNSVTGLDGLSNPSTDDLIQWASYKWGIPTDWIRAEAMQESHWSNTDVGDIATVSNADYGQYPALAQVSGSNCTSNCQAARSLGLMQVSWTPQDQSSYGFGFGTEPLRWKSIAFNLDFYAGVVRWYYDGHCSWCGSGYSAGQQWPSIGAWFEPTPWGNSGALSYESNVQQHLTNRDWPKP